MRLAVSLFACALALGGQDDGVLRVKVRLIHLLASVKDATGRIISDLAQNDFALLDNGVQQKISVFERETGQDLSVAILIDNSGSTAKDLRYEVDSVSRFARALFNGANDRDRAALFSFNYQVVRQVGFTHAASSIEHALHQLHGEAGTSLYDAIYLAAGELESRPGRHAMVIVTDGGDTTSGKDYHAALRAAQYADAVLFPVLVVPIENDAGRNTGGEHALTNLAVSTGGRVFEPTLGEALDRAFSDILRELRNQYLLAYYPKDTPSPKDRFHHVEVRVARPGLHIQTRSGYYEEP